MKIPTKRLKSPKFKPFASVQGEIFRDFPQVQKLWRETEPQRRINLMLVRLRKEKGLSQKQIADQAGWDKAFVSRLESSRNNRVPDADTVARYAAACGLTAGVVIGQPTGSGYMLVMDAMTLHFGSDQEQVNSFERLKNRKLKLNAESAG